MNAENLSTYLNDHLAGSVGALELIGHMMGTCADDAMKRWLEELNTEIQEDQETLRRVIATLGLQESGVRKAMAWVAEKVSRAKLPFAGGGGLDHVQALEGLLLGVTGKKSLWHTLASVPELAALLAAFDLADLERRADDHFARIRTKAESVAKAAF